MRNSLKTLNVRQRETTLLHKRPYVRACVCAYKANYSAAMYQVVSPSHWATSGPSPRPRLAGSAEPQLVPLHTIFSNWDSAHV